MTVAIHEPGPVERTVASAFVKAFLVPRFKGRGWTLPPHLNARPLRIPAPGGGTLAAHHVPHDDPHGIVVLAHPYRRYGQHWFARTPWLDLLHDGGYEALTFDFPRFGETKGGYMGYHESVLAAVDEARRLRPGLPVHVVGVSIGAFAAINAAPLLDNVESLLAESPYPDFASWYSAGRRSGVRRLVNAGFNRLFRNVMRRIHAAENIRHAAPRRVLITATRDDEVTPVALTRVVALNAPAARTTYLEFSGVPHLGLIDRPAYRAAVLDHLAGRPVTGVDPVQTTASPVLQTGATPDEGRQVVSAMASA